MRKIIAALLISFTCSSFASDAACLAKNMYYEAHAEKAKQARKAVAFVTLNRLKKYPDKYQGDVCKVVYEKNQFSWTRIKNKSPIDLATWVDYYEKANFILDNHDRMADPTNGATHFHANWMPSFPHWAYVLRKTNQIGQHIFYK
jgi:spore germination cell wall hydrolase CwlJ-like protein